MIRRKILWIATFLMLTGIFGCASSINLKPNTIIKTDKIGIISLKQTPRVFYSGFASGIAGGVLNDQDRFRDKVRSVKTHKLISRQFIEKSSIVNGSYENVHISKAIRKENNDIDFMATAKKNHLDYIMEVKSFMYLKEYYYNYQRFLKPTLKVSVKLIQAVDGVNVWSKNFKLKCDSVSSISYGKYDVCYDSLASKAVDILISDLQSQK